MNSTQKIELLKIKQRNEMEERKRNEKERIKEANAGDIIDPNEPSLEEKWGVKNGEFSGDDDFVMENVQIREEPETVGAFDDMPGVIREVQDSDVSRLAAEMVLAGTEMDRMSFCSPGGQMLGVVLLGDPRVAAEVVRLSAARLAALAGLVPEAYKAVLTDTGDEVGLKRNRLDAAKDLANRLGWNAPKRGDGAGAGDEWRTQRTKQRKAAEARWVGKSE